MMELEEWELLSDNSNTLSNPQAIEEIDQHGVSAQVVKDPTIEDPDEAIEKEIREVIEESLEKTEFIGESPKSINDEGIEEVEVEVSNLKISKSVTFKDEVEEAKEDGGLESNGKDCLDSFSLSIWRWRLSGIGALSSIGLTAATLVMLILGGRSQNPKLQIQIYSDDKKFKQVSHQATRLNQTTSTVRGAPATAANVSFGGYYQGSNTLIHFQQ